MVVFLSTTKGDDDVEGHITSASPKARSRARSHGAMCRAHGFDFEEPLFEVRNHAAALAALSPKADVIFDASFSPRLDYYTGIVFEMTGADGEVLASGGEYDRLLDRLGATELSRPRAARSGPSGSRGRRHRLLQAADARRSLQGPARGR